MNSNPKISVIVPIYNAEKFIDRCMKSIYEQTFTDYEIILVNDGSVDRSDELCRKYQEHDDRITYIKKENEGAGSARNRGIEAARGEYLAFPDVDDWFEPEMYKELYDLAESGDYDIVFSGANYYSQDGGGELEYSSTVNCDAVSYTTQEQCRDNVMTFFPTSTIFDVPWNKLYRRSVAIDNGVRFSNTRRCQDAMFNIDFYNYIKSAASVSKAYYNYIQNTAESVQRKFPKNYIDINIAYFDDLTSKLESWGMYHGNIKQHYDTSFVIAVYETISMFENPQWNLSKKEKKQYIVNIMDMAEVQKKLICADIRDDVMKQAEILRNKDYSAFIIDYRIKKLKDKLRGNKLLMRIYHGGSK